MKHAQQWLEEASSFIAEGNKHKAVTCYNQALADILFHKGNALYELGDMLRPVHCLRTQVHASLQRQIQGSDV